LVTEEQKDEETDRNEERMVPFGAQANVKAVPPNYGHNNNDHDRDHEISIVMCGRSGYSVRESVRERACGSDDPQP
jgi:hypothetical protein